MKNNFKIDCYFLLEVKVVITKKIDARGLALTFF